MKRQCWVSPPVGAHVAASSISQMSSSATESCFSRRIARVGRIASNRLIFRSICKCSLLRCCGSCRGPALRCSLGRLAQKITAKSRAQRSLPYIFAGLLPVPQIVDEGEKSWTVVELPVQVIPARTTLGPGIGVVVPVLGDFSFGNGCLVRGIV